ncbi:hypothetical protein AAUPMB_21977, partial [Pasteurella multocida subsp. multocida str. Anand1_buffalo]
EEKKAMRKALNTGAKVIEKEIKKDVPVLDKSTDFRQRATVKTILGIQQRFIKMALEVLLKFL